MARRNTVAPVEVRSMRPAISGMSGPPVAILPARRGGASPPKRASTRESESTRAPPPPRISARGTMTLVAPLARRSARSPEKELPRACLASAPAKRCASGAISVPSPVRASSARASCNCGPGRKPLASTSLRKSRRWKPWLARSEPSSMVRAALACGVTSPLSATVWRSSSKPSFQLPRRVRSAPFAL